jgi:tRNA-5-taurinomethyluridine 2-sulfurtransferase
MKKIAVLISGGVDSSVVLSLLKEQGYDVEAFYLKIWLEDELSYLGDCPWEEDLAYIRTVCDFWNVPLQVIPMQETYREKVVAYTIAEVRAGRTPSPDILCNEFVKFGAFYDVIGDAYDFVATGHYAQREDRDGVAFLKCAKDPIKDQTYFLSRLSQAQLKRAMFPIGHLLKSEVRQEAVRFNLPNQDRKDSQGICFLGKFKFADFIKHHVGTQPGDLIEFETGQKVGTHEGFWFYTIGQRKGIGLSGGPWFVAAKNTAQNIVYVSRTYYTDDKQRAHFLATDSRWISGVAPDEQCKVKIRHGETFYEALLTFKDDKKTLVQVNLNANDQGIAPGQFAVFYRDEYCLGAGVLADEKV